MNKINTDPSLKLLLRCRFVGCKGTKQESRDEIAKSSRNQNRITRAKEGDTRYRFFLYLFFVLWLELDSLNTNDHQSRWTRNPIAQHNQQQQQEKEQLWKYKI